MIKVPTNWEWQGPGGERKSWISEERAKILAEIRGGKAVELEDIKVTFEVAPVVCLPPREEKFPESAADYYGSGPFARRYNGD